MNNVIPLKKSTYLLPDDEFEALLQEVINHGRKFHDFTCYPAVMRKVLGDALKRDRHGPDLISTPEHVMDALWCEKFGPKLEQDDGESNVPA